MFLFSLCPLKGGCSLYTQLGGWGFFQMRYFLWPPLEKIQSCEGALNGGPVCDRPFHLNISYQNFNYFFYENVRLRSRSIYPRLTTLFNSLIAIKYKPNSLTLF